MADVIRFPSKMPGTAVPELALPLPINPYVTISEFDGRFYVSVSRRLGRADGYSISALDHRDAGEYASKADAVAVACDLAARHDLDVEDRTTTAPSSDGGTAA